MLHKKLNCVSHIDYKLLITPIPALGSGDGEEIQKKGASGMLQPPTSISGSEHGQGMVEYSPIQVQQVQIRVIIYNYS